MKTKIGEERQRLHQPLLCSPISSLLASHNSSSLNSRCFLQNHPFITIICSIRILFEFWARFDALFPYLYEKIGTHLIIVSGFCNPSDKFCKFPGLYLFLGIQVMGCFSWIQYPFYNSLAQWFFFFFFWDFG